MRKLKDAKPLSMNEIDAYQKKLLENAAELVGRTELDKAHFAVTHDIRETDPSAFIGLENKPL